jgi:hypothetical protein
MAGDKRQPSDKDEEIERLKRELEAYQHNFQRIRHILNTQLSDTRFPQADQHQNHFGTSDRQSNLDYRYPLDKVRPIQGQVALLRTLTDGRQLNLSQKRDSSLQFNKPNGKPQNHQFEPYRRVRSIHKRSSPSQTGGKYQSTVQNFNLTSKCPSGGFNFRYRSQKQSSEDSPPLPRSYPTSKPTHTL